MYRPLRQKSARELQQLELLERQKVRGNIHAAVCKLLSDPVDQQYAIREQTLDAQGVIVGVSDVALSPKAGSAEELQGLIEKLIEQAESGEVSCGESDRTFSKQTLEEWHLLIGLPVFSYRAQ